MFRTKLISSAVLVGALFGASQAAMAYEAGDILVRGNVVKEDPDSGRIDTDKTYGGSVGVMVMDKLGVTLGSSGEFEHALDSGDSFSSQPIDLMAQFYPLGGMDARVQPYAGIGANYTRFSDESDGLRLDNTWAPKAELGVDLIITDYLAVNGFVNYTDIKVDYTQDTATGSMSDDFDYDPVAIGAGVTFSF
nr:OmpW family outer membrane protein [uncultured Halomonas sp.]